MAQNLLADLGAGANYALQMFGNRTGLLSPHRTDVVGHSTGVGAPTDGETSAGDEPKGTANYKVTHLAPTDVVKPSVKAVVSDASTRSDIPPEQNTSDMKDLANIPDTLLNQNRRDDFRTKNDEDFASSSISLRSERAPASTISSGN